MVVGYKDYKITRAIGTYYDEFFESDLDELMDQTHAYDLVIRKVECYTADYHSSGEVHTVALAIDISGDLLVEGKAALPCPPDCPDKSPVVTPEIPIHFDDYKVDKYVIIAPSWLRSIMGLFGFSFYKIKIARKP